MTEAAYTKPDGMYPAYINIRETQHGHRMVTVRSPMSEGQHGVTATIEIAKDDFAALLREAAKL